MIKIKTTNNTLTDIGEVYVKTSPAALTKIAEVYRVTEQNGAKALERVYSAAPRALTPPTIISVHNEGTTVFVEYEPNANGDAVDFRFEEYAANGVETYDGPWGASGTAFTAYGCTEYVTVYARSVRDGEYSEYVTTDIYLYGEAHSPKYSGNGDGVHYISCDLCGESLGEGYCMDHDDNGDLRCDLCGDSVPV